jgi:hypothetical protein
MLLQLSLWAFATASAPTPPASRASWGPSAQGWTGKIKPFWFGANSSTAGLDNDATLALMAKHTVAGYGWQTGGADHLGAAALGRGESFGGSAVEHAVDYMQSHGHGNVTIFQYRQVQVALSLFAENLIAASNPANEHFWLHDTKTKDICTGKQPWGTDDYYWNFTDSGAVDYWIEKAIGELTTDGGLVSNAPYSAVFFDEVDQSFCGYTQGSCNFTDFNLPQLQGSNNAMLTRLVGSLNAAGITPILSMDNRMHATGDTLPCALSEDDTVAALKGLTWVRFYENWPSSFWHKSGPDENAAMVENAILEGAAGIPTALHIAGKCPAPARTIVRPGPLGGPIEFAIASYLIVATPGTTLSISQGWHDKSFCWHSEFDVVYGTPLGPALRSGNYTFSRNYTRCNVEIDAGQKVGRVDLLE